MDEAIKFKAFIEGREKMVIFTRIVSVMSSFSTYGDVYFYFDDEGMVIHANESEAYMHVYLHKDFFVEYEISRSFSVKMNIRMVEGILNYANYNTTYGIRLGDIAFDLVKATEHYLGHLRIRLGNEYVGPHVDLISQLISLDMEGIPKSVVDGILRFFRPPGKMDFFVPPGKLMEVVEWVDRRLGRNYGLIEIDNHHFRLSKAESHVSVYGDTVNTEFHPVEYFTSIPLRPEVDLGVYKGHAYVIDRSVLGKLSLFLNNLLSEDTVVDGDDEGLGESYTEDILWLDHRLNANDFDSTSVGLAGVFKSELWVRVYLDRLFERDGDCDKPVEAEVFLKMVVKEVNLVTKDDKIVYRR